MDSHLKLLKRLFKEGESFTFDNFCLPNMSYPGEFGGQDTPDWRTFKTRVSNTVSELMDPSSPAVNLVKTALRTGTEGNGPDKFEFVKGNLLKALELSISTVEDDVFGELKKQESDAGSPALSNKVFIVHGHDQSLKTDVERFVHEIGLKPIVLHREADEGNTIIEKFEKHSDVGFAFILLTPDEVAYLSRDEGVDDSKRKKELRARPNVIFEFGYFVGKLGRSRVCCLHKGDVSVPSDLDGLVYKRVSDSIDAEAFSIIRELKAAGYTIQV